MLTGVEASILRPRKLFFLVYERTFCMLMRVHFFAKIGVFVKLLQRSMVLANGRFALWHLTPKRGIQKRGPLGRKE